MADESQSGTEMVQEVNVGLAADIGTLQRLPKITGNDSLVREIALTGRNFGAAEAAQMGLTSRVVKGGRAEVVGASVFRSSLCLPLGYVGPRDRQRWFIR